MYIIIGRSICCGNIFLTHKSYSPDNKIIKNIVKVLISKTFSIKKYNAVGPE